MVKAMMNNSTVKFGSTSINALNSLICGTSDPINNQIPFTIEGVMLSTICFLGVLGNVTTFYVLSNIQSRYNIFNNLLMQLVTGDSISLILIFVDFSLRKGFQCFTLDDVWYGSIWPKIMYPSIKISYTWIMCCTMAITIERYIAICHPFIARQDAFELSIRSHTSNSSSFRRRDIEPSRKRFYQYSLIVVIISCLSNIPVFLEFTSRFDADNQRMKINISPLRINENYIIFYKNGIEGVIMMILPFTAMICFNIKIICTLTQRQRYFPRGTNSRRIPSTERNLGKVLIAMDIVFLFCNLGRFVVNVWEILHIDQLKQCLKISKLYKIPTWVSILMSLNHFLHGLSASLNLIIISITGSKFRKTLVKLFGPKSTQEENEIKQKKFACKKTSEHLEVKNVTFEDNHDIVQSNSQ